MSNLLRPHLQPVQFAGGYIGIDQSFAVFSETEGKALKRIRVHRAARTIRAIEIWLTGDSNPRVYGNPGGESSTFEFREGERITILQLQNNQPSAPFPAVISVGRIVFQTSMLRNFDFGMSVQPTGQVIRVDVGSGVCVGLRGVVVLSHINMLGFVFLRQIESVTFAAVEYPTISTPNITTTILEQLPGGGTLQNDDDHEPLHWVLAGSRQFVTSSTWKQPANGEGLVSYLNNIPINLDLGIVAPKLVTTGPAGASTTFRWETARTFPSTDAIRGSIADLTVSTDQYSVWCHVSDTLGPGQSLITRRAALVGEGNINNLLCSARIQVFTNTSSGSVLPFATFSFPVQVLYSAQAHSDVQILS